MVDWTKPMQQTFEYYVVSPETWKDSSQITDVTSCAIERDSTAETLGSASISVGNPISECYVRAYLVTIQNGITDKHPLGTFLVQTPSNKFDGRTSTITADAFTPLIELKENPPPLGYAIAKDSNIMQMAYDLILDKVRAPVVEPKNETLLTFDFVSNTDDTWLTFLNDLIANAKYSFGLDEMGRVLFLPIQDMASLQPVWTYNDDNSSILYPDVTLEHDFYEVPNVVEVVYSNNDEYYFARVVNDDPSSITSTVNRGREVTHRETNPSISGTPIDTQIQEYAEQLLKNLSSVEYSITYSHGYCPVRIGDCVRLNYEAAGIKNVKAKVVSQSIECKTGCKVTEKAVFTTKLWR